MAGRMIWRALAILGLWSLVSSVVMAAGSGPTIFDAIKAGDTEKVRAMLDAPGADAELQDAAGHSLLTYAAAFGRLDIADLLLAKGAKVATRNRGGYTALHFAVSYGRKDSAMYLIAHGADVNARSDAPSLQTPLYEVLLTAYQTTTGAAATGLDMARLLLDHGADVNAVSGNDKATLLDSACGFGLRAFVQLLLDRGADVNIRNANGQTPLYAAARQGYALAAAGARYDPQILSMLLGKGLDPNVADKDGQTPLLAGAEQTDAVRLLLAAGANPNAKNDHGLTPLLAAVHWGQTDAVRLLLAAGAEVDVADPQGNTPLHYARNKDVDALLLERGADVNARNKFGQTPLFLAASGAEHDSVEFLLTKGADITLTSSDGTTPLHAAASSGKPDAASSLIGKGIKVDVKNDLGETPLYLAAAGKHIDVVQVLLTRGADVNAETQMGQTPLHAAVEAGATDIAKLLVANGADTSIRDKAGFTPLDKLSREEVAEILSARKGSATPEDVDAARSSSDPGNAMRQVNGLDLGYSSAAPVMAAAREAGVEPLVYALQQPGLADLKALLQNGVLKRHPELAQRGDGDHNILVLAVKRHRDDALELLLDSGVDPNIPDEDKDAGNAISVAVSNQGSIGAEKLLLERGASPNSVVEMGSDWVLAMRKPDDRKVEFEKYELLFRHGMDPKNTLFSAIWDVARAQNRLGQFCNLRTCQSDAQAIEDLASTAEHAGDVDGATFLRRAYAYGAATQCPKEATTAILETCLPAALSRADTTLNQRYQEQLKGATTAAAHDALHSAQTQWLKTRDATCHLAYPWSDRDGWSSYVLSDTERASCVLDLTNERIVVLGGGG